MTVRRSTVVVLIAVALAAACVSPAEDVSVRDVVPPASTAPTTEPEPGSTTTTTDPDAGPGELSEWTDCGDGLQCATLTVPLDWDRPEGDTIPIAVARKPATADAGRIGSVLFNPGGPGEPGTGWLRDFLAADRIPEGLDERLDLVSWDPRGTGGSAGVECLSDDELAAPDIDPTIEDQADVEAIRSESADAMAACERNAGDRLDLVGTRNTVRDLDALRAALGDDRLTYVGYSYGTTIGTEYLRMFPENVRAMVLDGVAIPGGDPVEDTHEQARSFEANLRSFLDECADRSTCLFGGGDPRGAWDDLVADLEAGNRYPGSYALPDENGAFVRREGTVGIGELYTGVLAALYARENWIAIETGLALLAQGDGQIILSLRDSYVGRQPDGTWKHTLEAFGAISCADQVVRADDADGDDALRDEWSQELPLLGSLFATGTPGCYGFPESREPLTEPSMGEITGVPPVVIVGSTGDPATPYQASEDLQALVPESVLVTWDAADHTAYGRGSSCLDEPITAYLETLIPPQDGLTCEP